MVFINIRILPSRVFGMEHITYAKTLLKELLDQSVGLYNTKPYLPVTSIVSRKSLSGKPRFVYVQYTYSIFRGPNIGIGIAG